MHDNPALAAACRAAEHVVPLFVFDPAVPSSPNRDRFLIQCLADLRESLRARGGDLLLRRGDPVAEALKVARKVDATGIAVARDASAYAKRRERRLAQAGDRFAVKTFPGSTVVEPGALLPTGGGDHYRVFTPYWRAWLGAPRRPVEAAPRTVALPDGLPASVPLPTEPAGGSEATAAGGETAGRRGLTAWLGKVDGYADTHDLLATDGTSRLSPFLHFGAVSANEVCARVPVTGPFARQLCWRDFHHQVLNAFPELGRKSYRADREPDWRDDPEGLDAWREGRTGVSIVDAGMRQLAAEGWMHNRARLITASYLTKELRIDWRAGAEHFMSLLLDADVANNHGNWQWVAGTGNDTKPYRRFNPDRQAERFDPDGAYVRRYVS